MSFIRQKDFKTKQQELRKRKRDALKREAQKFSKNFLKQKEKESVRTFSVSNQKQKNDIFTLQMLTNEKIVQLQQKGNKIFNFKNDYDHELYLRIKSKLAVQEQICREQKEKIQQLNRNIQEIKTANAILKGINRQKQQQINNYQEQITSQNQYLKKKTYDMQKYLSQNGAMWSINGIQGNLNIHQIKKQINLAKDSNQILQNFCLETINKRIDQLNENLLKQKGNTAITNTNGVFQFCSSQSISLLFYRDGINFDGIGFYAYENHEGLRIIKDLNDGYFPHVLKYQYPQGIFMKIENRLNECYHGQSSGKWFLGEGILISDN